MGYRDSVLVDSPIGYWRLGETSGTTAVDETGNGHDATLSGSYTLGTDSLIASDTANKSITFSSSTGKATASALGVSYTQWSIEAWIKPDDVVGNPNAISTDVSGYSDDILFGIQPWTSVGVPANTIGLWHQNSADSAGTSVADTEPAVVGSVYHVVVTCDGSTLRLYVNGVEKASTPKAGSALTFGNHPICIGRNPRLTETTYQWKGAIDEVAFYGAALTATRIQAHYDAGIAAAVLLSGTITEAGVAVARTVRAYRRDTGALLTEQTSAVDGTYSFSDLGGYTGEVYIIALDDDSSHNDMILDRLVVS